MEKGAAWFSGFGTKESTGTKLMSVSGDCARPGVYEVPFGITVNELLDLVGAPDAQYVQMSGPSGQAVAPKDFGRRIAYEDLSTGGSTMIFGPQRDVLEIALQFADFFVDESCGWCTPCRVGTTLLKQGMEKIVAGRATLADIAATEALANTVDADEPLRARPDGAEPDPDARCATFLSSTRRGSRPARSRRSSRCTTPCARRSRSRAASPCRRRA